LCKNILKDIHGKWKFIILSFLCTISLLTQCKTWMHLLGMWGGERCTPLALAKTGCNGCQFRYQIFFWGFSFSDTLRHIDTPNLFYKDFMTTFEGGGGGSVSPIRLVIIHLINGRTSKLDEHLPPTRSGWRSLA
jgi:hypothetical protein